MAIIRTKRLEFQVTGKFSFPLDMLRYDCCWPKGQEDVAVLAGHLDNLSERSQSRGQVTVTLASDIESGGYAEKVKQGPTDARWQSFLWEVVPGSVKIDNRTIR